jgi:hypothetical protein
MQSDSIAKLAEAIAKAQQQLKPVKRECRNPFYNSKYADLASVWEALKPFADNGIAITQLPRESSNGQVYLDTQLTHVSGEWMRSTICLPAAKLDPQGVGSALTYARRYAIGCMTGVVTEEDDDGNQASTAKQPAATYTKHKQAAAKKIAELKVETIERLNDENWETFLDYMSDDPDRTAVGKQLKELLCIGKVAELKGSAREEFVKQFQDSCKETGVPCEAWV